MVSNMMYTLHPNITNKTPRGVLFGDLRFDSFLIENVIRRQVGSCSEAKTQEMYSRLALDARCMVEIYGLQKRAKGYITRTNVVS